MNIIPCPKTYVEYGGRVKLSEKDFIFQKRVGIKHEGYEIIISKAKALVYYGDESGLFYAKNTLSQIRCQDGTYPLVRISDSPRFSYRAFMIDSARHMQTVDEIKAYIEAAARFKMNVFHWHLCDDQGWRIESQKYPKLMTIGAFRNGHGFGSKNEDVYGGYYTKDEIRDIIAFCKERQIDVIPEIDMPGHTIAMLASYNELGCRNQPIDVATDAGVHKPILCSGREGTFEFCFNILDEVCELFPYDCIHIGGDEAPKNRWNECPDCQERIRREGLKNSEELQGYFGNRIIEYLEQKGKTVIVWNESLKSGMLKNSAIVADWMDKEHLCEPWANKGGKLIVEDFYHYYLDYPYGMTPLKKTYDYDPYLEGLDEEGKKNVIGVETPIWTEFVEDFERMSYMCFPRLMAVAETGWSQWGNRNYADFVRRAEANRAELNSIGISMAPKCDWDPSPIGRLKGFVSHYKRFVTVDMVKDFFKKDKDE